MHLKHKIKEETTYLYNGIFTNAIYELNIRKATPNLYNGIITNA